LDPGAEGVEEIAIATGRAWKDLPDEERQLASELERRGFRCAAAVWDDPAEAYGPGRAVLVRSCWDYHLRIREFLDFLGRLESAGGRVLNPVPLLRWNSDKRYLLDLRRAGVRIPESRVVERGGSAPALRAAIEDLAQGGAAVVKPLVSASAHETRRVERGDVESELPRLERLARGADLLVQEYVVDVASRGEWSLVHLGGAPSHAVLKRPAEGDFRVQAEHGGTVAPAVPPARLVAAAERAIAAAPGDPVIARVDLVDAAPGEPILMELELIEPQLFLATAPGSAARCADAVARRLSG
jgi:glutathione synthase/RimK-type ligase-like ATP-grasp enzyme